MYDPSAYERGCLHIHAQGQHGHRPHARAGLIYTRLIKGEEYTNQGQNCYAKPYRERVLRALSQRAAKRGMQMVPIAQPA